MFRFPAFCLAVFLPTVAAAQDCKPIRFAPGDDGAFIDDVLPPKVPDGSGGPRCYSLDVRKGQRVSVEVVGGDENVAVSVIDVGDARRSFDFVAPSSRVEFIVFQLLPSPEEADYSLLVKAF